MGLMFQGTETLSGSLSQVFYTSRCARKCFAWNAKSEVVNQITSHYFSLSPHVAPQGWGYGQGQGRDRERSDAEEFREEVFNSVTSPECFAETFPAGRPSQASSLTDSSCKIILQAKAPVISRTPTYCIMLFSGLNTVCLAQQTAYRKLPFLILIKHTYVFRMHISIMPQQYKHLVGAIWTQTTRTVPAQRVCLHL